MTNPIDTLNMPAVNATELTPLKRAFLALEDAQARLAAMEQAAREPIAVIGLGCRVPGGGNDPASFWRLMHDGVDAIGTIPADRWDANALYDPDPETPGRIATRCGGFLHTIDQFDPSFFNISPREAMGMDPQQRLLLEVSWEALEHAGQAPDRLERSLTGVYMGVASSDYTYLQLKTRNPALLDAHFASGIAHSVVTGRLSYLLGLQGPSVTIDTACSSSLVAVHLACTALRNGECRMAVAGGVNLILAPDLFIALSHSRMLAPDGRCKTFDVAADGFARGEGCGVIVLKRLNDAQANGDRILGLIRGSAVNQDGPSSGLTAPNGPAQEAVIRAALSRAGVAPGEVGYVEAHGTGTQLGDPLEVNALGAVFAADRNPARPLLIGSVKTNIGHLESAAGVASLIKVILALQHRTIPPHLHFHTPSPHIAWAELPLQVPTKAVAWEPIGGRRIGGVSSFGFSGTNAHVVVEEAPPCVAVEEAPVHRSCLLALSARDDKAFAELASRFADALKGRSDDELTDVCHTANAGRAHFAHRGTVIGHTVGELRTGLTALARGENAMGVRTARIPRRDPPRIAFLFTGQGAQYAGMSQDLYGVSPVFRAALDQCAAQLAPHLERPLLEVLFPERGKPTPIDETAYTQPALFAVEYALYELWRSWGVTPNAVMGHSVGEYVAACISGVLNLEDALRLIAKRGRLMQSLPGGGAMAAIFVPEQQVAEAIAPHTSYLSIAAINGPSQTVISGRAAEVEAVCQHFMAQGVRCQPLPVSHAFHSPLVDPILEEFEREANAVRFVAPRMRLISNLTGRLAEASEITQPHYWRRHVREAVRFGDGLRTLAMLRPELIIEIGPNPILLPFAGSAFDEVAPGLIPSLRKGRPDWEQMLEGLAAGYSAGVQVDWHGVSNGASRRIVDLPTYPFQRQRYWFPTTETPPPDAASNCPTADQGTAGRPAEQWMYERQWEPQPHALKNGDERRRAWVVLADRGRTGTGLVTALRARGDRCLIHSVGEGGTVDDRASLLESPLLLHRKLCRQWRKQLGDVLGIIDLRWLDTVAWQTPGCASLEGALSAPISDSLALIQAMLAEFADASSRLWLVTRGTQPAGEVRAPLSPWQAAAWGLGWSLALEHPEFQPVCIDLDPVIERDEIVALASELGQDGHEDQVALRDGKRLVARLARLGALKGGQVDPPVSTLARPDGNYLITGGLSGLGLAAAQWLVEQGARHLALVGRRGVTEEASRVLDTLRSTGAAITTAPLDIADASATAAFLECLRKAGVPLRGVLHAAGVTDDGAVLAQDWTRFERVLRPKAGGVQVLDHLTRSDPLDWFVMFSSAASLIGSPGQANYSAANAILDCVAHERRRVGLPAQSINWGPWQQIGLAAGQELQHHVTAQGFTSMTPREGVLALGEIMRDGNVQVGAVRADWTQVVARRSASGVPPYFSKLVDALANGTESMNTEPETRTSLRERLEAAAPGRRRAIVKSFVRECTVQVLADGNSMIFEDRQPLGELGLDSLLAVELRNTLSRSLGVGLSATLLFDYPSVEAVADHLLNEVLIVTKEARRSLDAEPAAGAGSGSAVLAEISQLPEEEIERLLATEQ